MAPGASFGNISSMLVVQNVNVALLAKVLQQQKAAGLAAVGMIEGSAPAPQKGAPEPGKGQLVDVVA